MKDKVIEEVLMVDKVSKTETIMIKKKKWVNKDTEDKNEAEITVKMKDKIIEEDLMKDKKDMKNNLKKII